MTQELSNFTQDFFAEDDADKEGGAATAVYEKLTAAEKKLLTDNRLSREVLTAFIRIIDNIPDIDISQQSSFLIKEPMMHRDLPLIFSLTITIEPDDPTKKIIARLSFSVEDEESISSPTVNKPFGILKAKEMCCREIRFDFRKATTVIEGVSRSRQESEIKGLPTQFFLLAHYLTRALMHKTGLSKTTLLAIVEDAAVDLKTKNRSGWSGRRAMEIGFKRSYLHQLLLRRTHPCYVYRY